MRLTKRDRGLDHYDIILPMFETNPWRWSETQVRIRFPSDITVVEWNAIRRNRDAVERLAYYFRREFGYDFVQYNADEGPGDERYPAVAFLWASMRNSFDDRDVAVGATCFRWREWKDTPAGWAMQWIWLHPYVRRKGLLSAAWPALREAFGDFDVEPPLSPAMRMFLAKVNATTESGE